ncbi:TetR family transcriptional regulator [Desulfovibrio ferrophilus]|uniref:TetR family transcriptional regulator n=1 Tax=Desulfovibrio ferrophilus TaxID=241368 RepID=A0A2Z6B2W3_9BACT|nr:TetR family transcriptional regulator [Desulfovibrio ferrophilus]
MAQGVVLGTTLDYWRRSYEKAGAYPGLFFEIVKVRGCKLFAHVHGVGDQVQHRALRVLNDAEAANAGQVRGV